MPTYLGYLPPSEIDVTRLSHVSARESRELTHSCRMSRARATRVRDFGRRILLPLYTRWAEPVARFVMDLYL